MARCAEIYAHHVLHGTASFEVDPPDLAEMKRRRAAVLDIGLPHLVAEREGRVMGYAYAGNWRPRPAYKFSVEDSVYIDKDAVGQGVGKALLPALIEQCTALGKRQMVAVIGDSAQTPSIRLHASCGFEMVGTLKNIGFKFGRWLDRVLMQRELGKGSVEPPAQDARGPEDVIPLDRAFREAGRCTTGCDACRPTCRAPCGWSPAASSSPRPAR